MLKGVLILLGSTTLRQVQRIKACLCTERLLVKLLGEDLERQTI